jgi:hypothetical protein
MLYAPQDIREGGFSTDVDAAAQVHGVRRERSRHRVKGRGPDAKARCGGFGQKLGNHISIFGSADETFVFKIDGSWFLVRGSWFYKNCKLQINYKTKFDI